MATKELPKGTHTRMPARRLSDTARSKSFSLEDELMWHQKLTIGAVIVFGLAVAANASSPKEAPGSNLVKFPLTIDPECNFGRAKLYDECGSQLEIFEEALKVANERGKTLLVSFGAEWCIWCHVFDEYLVGSHTVMEYRYSDPGEKIYHEVTRFERPESDPTQEANDLKTFVEESFVIVHIENRFSPDGFSVLERSNAVDHFSGGLPFIFTVNRNGQYAAALNSKQVETRRDTFDWYRGYDRNRLTEALTKMIEAAQ